MELVDAAITGEATPIPARPAYCSKPPSINNWDIVPDYWRERQERIFGRVEAVLPPAHLIKCHDVKVFAQGAVQTSSGRFIAETMHKQETARPAEGKEVKKIDGPVALLRK